MTTFDDRERAHEALFARDSELQFRAQARSTREIALWAAGETGRSGAAAEDYAAEILRLAIDGGGGEAVLARLGDDLAKHGRPVSHGALRQKMAALLAAAVETLRRR